MTKLTYIVLYIGEYREVVPGQVNKHAHSWLCESCSWVVSVKHGTQYKIHDNITKN